MFFRKSKVDPLPITMTAVKMGDRLLQVGLDESSTATALAARVGLSGTPGSGPRRRRLACWWTSAW